MATSAFTVPHPPLVEDPTTLARSGSLSRRQCLNRISLAYVYPVAQWGPCRRRRRWMTRLSTTGVKEAIRAALARYHDYRIEWGGGQTDLPDRRHADCHGRRWYRFPAACRIGRRRSMRKCFSTARIPHSRRSPDWSIRCAPVNTPHQGSYTSCMTCRAPHWSRATSAPGPGAECGLRRGALLREMAQHGPGPAPGE